MTPPPDEWEDETTEVTERYAADIRRATVESAEKLCREYTEET